MELEWGTVEMVDQRLGDVVQSNCVEHELSLEDDSSCIDFRSCNAYCQKWEQMSQLSGYQPLCN